MMELKKANYPNHEPIARWGGDGRGLGGGGEEGAVA